MSSNEQKSNRLGAKPVNTAMKDADSDAVHTATDDKGSTSQANVQNLRLKAIPKFFIGPESDPATPDTSSPLSPFKSGEQFKFEGKELWHVVLKGKHVGVTSNWQALQDSVRIGAEEVVWESFGSLETAKEYFFENRYDKVKPFLLNDNDWDIRQLNEEEVGKNDEK